MDVYRISFLEAYGNCSFGDKNRIFLSVNLRIMTPNNTLIGSIYYFNVVGCRSKTFISIKVNAISVECPTLVIYFRIFNKIASVFSGVVKTTFTIYSTRVAYYGGRTVEVACSCLRIKIKLLRVNRILRVLNFNLIVKLIVF